MTTHTKILSIIAVLFLLTCTSFAGLNLVGTNTQVNSQIVSTKWGTEWEHVGEYNGYPPSFPSYKIIADADIQSTDDLITNMFKCNKYNRYDQNYYQFAYDSALDFTVTADNGYHGAYLTLSDGSLYIIDGVLLVADNGTYEVPLDTTITAVYNVDYTTTILENDTVLNNPPLQTFTQAIALQGYAVPEPATMGLLSLGGIISLFRKRRA